MDQSSIMVVKYPCGICQKAVGVKHKAICCDICNKWIHIACNNLDKKTYQKLQESNINWFCITCIKKEIPFASQSDNELKNIYNGKHIVPFKKEDMMSFTDKINSRINDNPEEISRKSLYYDINEFNNLDIKNNQFSLLHLNISSLQYHFEEFTKLLDTSKTKFSVIGITESRLKEGLTPTTNINLKNYKKKALPQKLGKVGLCCIFAKI